MAATFDLVFEIEGVPEVSRRLNITAEGVTDFRKPLRQIGDELQKTFQMNFSQRGGLFGGWAPRKPQYKDGVRVDTWPLMEKTGAMRKSFRDNVTPTKIVLFNTSPYFMYHQSRQSRSRLPRRVMMKIDQDRKTFIVKAFQAYLVGLLRGKR